MPDKFENIAVGDHIVIERTHHGKLSYHTDSVLVLNKTSFRTRRGLTFYYEDGAEYGSRTDWIRTQTYKAYPKTFEMEKKLEKSILRRKKEDVIYSINRRLKEICVDKLDYAELVDFNRKLKLKGFNRD